MKKSIKLPLTFFSIGLVVALVFFGWSVKAKDDATFRLANGVEVTPIEVKPDTDEALTLLDAKIWKFDVVLPDRTKSYYYQITAYKHGKATGTIGGLETGPAPGESNPSSSVVTVAMMPLGGGNFDAASQVKYTIRVYGAGSEGVFANPIKGCHTYSTESQTSPADSLIYLMNGNESNISHGEVRLNDVTLALSIQPLAQPFVVKD
jgi:hypothetical protein